MSAFSDSYVGSPGMFGSFTPVLAQLIPDFLAIGTQRDLARCGYYSPTAYPNYLAVRNVAVLGMILATACWVIAVSDDTRLSWTVVVAGSIATLLTFAIPRVCLSLIGDRRANRILSDMPDALDMMVMALGGGLSLQQSLIRTAEELRSTAPELSDEFAIISRQTSVDSLENAFSRFAQRLDVEELTMMIGTIRQAATAGTPLVDLMRQHAEQFRSMRLQRALQRGNTITLKLLFPTILCLAPAAFIVILSPPLLELRSFRDRENGANGALSQQSLSDKVKPRTPR